MKNSWQAKSLGEVCDIVNGGTPKTNVSDFWGGNILWITGSKKIAKISLSISWIYLIWVFGCII